MVEAGTRGRTAFTERKLRNIGLVHVYWAKLEKSLAGCL